MGLKCALLHTGWTRDAGEFYRSAGNLLLSELMGAELFVDETPRPIEDESPLQDFAARLRAEGRDPYVIPGGASDHRLGSLGYMNCGIYLVEQSQQLGRSFDYVVHCTGSGSTQSGLLAGFCALHAATKVIGIADDEETEIKAARVWSLAKDTLEMLGLVERVARDDVTVLSVDQSPYGQADHLTLECIRDFASNEGLIADPVYEGKAIRGLVDLARRGFFPKDARVLLMHLGGSPAIHAYANKFGEPKLENITRVDG
jgi:1-aminocyclopropane-1-carboxylate deaminase